ncbi:MAG: lysylphosphatidylglycerol synthase transmembrane domain-containing protein [Pseudomonadota bacterium]
MKKIFVRFLISLVIGGGMLYLAARNMPLSGAWDTLSQARWLVLFPYFAVMAAQHFFRSWRWQHLLAPIHSVPFKKILPVTSVGFFAILALPLRMGEFVRPYLIADPPHLRMSHAFGTLAVERVFDGLLLSLAAFGTILLSSTRTEVPAWVNGAGIASLGLFFVALLVLIMTLWQRERAVTMCQRMFNLFSASLAAKAAGLAKGIVKGFEVLPDMRRLGAFVFATAAYWFLNGVAIWVLAFGFDLNLSLEGSIAFVALVGIGIMIPAGPGFIGNFELFALAALNLYLSPSIEAKTRVGFVLAAHGTNALWYIVTGVLGMLSPHVRFTRVWHASIGSKTISDKEMEVN